MSDQPKLTEAMKAEYLAHKGRFCPNCKSTDIVSPKHVQTDIGIAWQECECGTCNLRWVDLYDLVGVRDVGSATDH